jgi:AraC-like DNA-binding protein
VNLEEFALFFGLDGYNSTYMSKINKLDLFKSRRKAVIDLIESGERTTGLSLTLKLFESDLRLPSRITLHLTPVCQAMKKLNQYACNHFVYRDVLVSVPSLPEGRIHRCPHGLTEIAVPVSRDGVVQGVLLGGQCWTGSEPPPYQGLIIPKDEHWLEDRRRVLLCLAGELGRILIRRGFDNSRADLISAYIHRSYQGEVSIEGLALELHLSPSRTRHVVRESFGLSFTNVVNSYRMEKAAELLETSQLAVGEISSLVGIDDQAYLTRQFTHRYRMSPLKWRQKSVRNSSLSSP